MATEASRVLEEEAATSPDRPDRPDRDVSSVKPGRPAAASAPTASADMTMRSWYMPKAAAEQLAALVDDVHFATRLPKHLIMGAAVAVLEQHRTELEATAREAAAQ